MLEYEIYLPSCTGDGEPIGAAKLDALKRRLRERFGGVTYFPQHNEGQWRLGSATFKETMTIARVLAATQDEPRSYFLTLKEDLKREFAQKEILITERVVTVL